MIKQEDVVVGKILWDIFYGVGKVIHVDRVGFVVEFANHTYTNNVGVEHGGKFDHCVQYDTNKHYDMNNLSEAYFPDKHGKRLGIRWIPMEFLTPMQGSVVFKLTTGTIVTGFLGVDSYLYVEDVSSHDDRPVFLTETPVSWAPLDYFQ